MTKRSIITTLKTTLKMHKHDSKLYGGMMDMTWLCLALLNVVYEWPFNDQGCGGLVKFCSIAGWGMWN